MFECCERSSLMRVVNHLELYSSLMMSCLAAMLFRFGYARREVKVKRQRNVYTSFLFDFRFGLNAWRANSFIAIRLSLSICCSRCHRATASKNLISTRKMLTHDRVTLGLFLLMLLDLRKVQHAFRSFLFYLIAESQLDNFLKVRDGPGDNFEIMASSISGVMETG
ncbi:hypothetical protein OUZ56_027632 [Daphnia magna]|uniref:Uncharacterized protein n=1 Tax=Daphnia magna TaxID=35525 RepID=A0ABR0B1G8_9CRUS|nr:hypothetical protein OUZ56_027632 [Daphnia magna]